MVRVELLLAEANSLKDIIWIESQLTGRHAELDSLTSTAPGPDRDLGRDLEICYLTVHDGGPVLAAESVTGPLH